MSGVSEGGTSNPAPARIAVIGAGAIGCLYGGMLQRAGERVVYVTRTAPVLRARGIRTTGPQGGWSLPAVEAHEDTCGIGTVDLVLVTLKTTANGELARLLPPLVGPRTVVATLQNGLGNEEWIASIVPGAIVLGVLCFTAVSRIEAGLLEVFHSGTVTIGRHSAPVDAAVLDCAARFNRAGVPARTGDRLAELRWRKLVWNIPFNGLTIAAGGVDTSRIMASPGLMAEARALMEEVREVAAAEGCDIPESFLQGQMDITPKLGPYRPSSLIDHLEGRPIELHSIWGEPVRRADASGVPVPRIRLLLALLSALSAGQ